MIKASAIEIYENVKDNGGSDENAPIGDIAGGGGGSVAYITHVISF